MKGLGYGRKAGTKNAIGFAGLATRQVTIDSDLDYDSCWHDNAAKSG